MTTEMASEKVEKGAEKAAGLPKLLTPYLTITAFYVAIGLGLAGALTLWPRLADLLPVGGAVQLGAAGQRAFETGQPVQPAASTLAEGVRLALAMLGSFLLMLPVTWICMGARRRKDVSQSFIQTILVLPMVITGIVHVVHNSLALAFSLAGIVAGVRFRHTLKDSAETTYLFTAIAVGVAGGINAVEVAAIVSIFFNYTVLGLWATEFGAENTGRQMFSRRWMAKEEERKRSEPKAARDDDEDDD